MLKAMLAATMFVLWLAYPLNTPEFTVTFQERDGVGIDIYEMDLIFNGPTPTTLRVLVPDRPAEGQPHRFVYLLRSNLTSMMNTGTVWTRPAIRVCTTPTI